MKKGILITGAMGGLGNALVEAAKKLKDVDCIAATDIDKEILNRYKDDARIIGLVMDVSSQKSIQDVREKIHRKGISIKYIVNNAGIAMFFPISEAGENQLDKILKVNTYGPVLTVSTFINDLIENKGRVVQISSDNVRLSGLFQPYASSKIALESLSVGMRQELGLQDIKLILIRPGAIKTDLLNEVERAVNPARNSAYNDTFARFREIAKKEVGRTVEPSKVATLVLKALLAKNPKLAYSINKNAKISFLVKFPRRWIDYLMKKTVLTK
jgi:NAD(P)-dependent dehydrogenase (short-subunit alcohol dehydrogenase family)